jgi:hypothetical protein
MNVVERAITAKLITTAMNAGWTVAGTDATSDGRYEAWPECMTLEQCVARAHEERESVDEIRFFFSPPAGMPRQRCWVFMINANGNDGFDLISDHADTPAFNAAVMDIVNGWTADLTMEQFLESALNIIDSLESQIKELQAFAAGQTQRMTSASGGAVPPTGADWDLLAEKVCGTCAETLALIEQGL